MISIHLTGIVYDSVFTILKGVREDIYVHVRSLPCKVIDYNIFYVTVYIFSFINIILL